MKKKKNRKKRGFKGISALFLAAAVLAGILYLSGGTRVYRPDPSRRAEIEANDQALRAMADAEPINLNAAVQERRKAALAERKGIMVDNIAAEQDRILAMTEGSKSDLMRWFENAAIVGDSVTDDIRNYGWLKAPVFAKTGIRAAEDLPLLDEVEAAKPSVIFLCFGMNDMEVYKGNVDIFAQRYKGMIQRLHITLPDAVIYANAVFPCADRVLEKKSFYKYRDTYNQALQAVCEETGAYYIDSSFLLLRRPEFFNKDGMHMTHQFYGYWLYYLADIAGLSSDEQ